MTPLVTVCMPASRDTQEFRTALRSVLDQGLDDLEVLVGDDSGGRLLAAVQDAGDPRVTHVANPERLGFTRNHTMLLDRARSRYIAFLHDDDRWLPGYLEAAVARLEDDPGAGMVCTEYLIDRGTGELTPDASSPPPGRHAAWLTLVLAHSTFIPSNTVMRREVWEQVRREWPDVVIGDLVLWLDAAQAGWAMHWLPEPRLVYRYHPEQISADEAAERHARVVVFSGYRFDEPEAERLRRARLGRAHVASAGLALREGDRATARVHLRAVRGVAPWAHRPKRALYATLANAPGLLGVANSAWRLARPRTRRADAPPLTDGP
jgi:glycosyltransferase involved in cell wall biosynthesis